MDGREGMTFSGGPASYYIHRGGIAGSASGTHTGAFQAPPGFRPNTGTPTQPYVRGSPVGPTYSSVEPQPGRTSYSHSHDHGHGISIGSSSGEPVKRKRGRPRKYGPDGPVSLGLSPMSVTANSTPAPTSPSQKRSRGRPKGSGRKQKLANLGEWMNSSAGMAFAPHVVTIEAGEDIVAKLLSISQQRPRVLCILSATGSVSSVTLRQPASTAVSITLEGQFQILCLSGSYLVAEDGGIRKRTGGLSVSLANPEGHVIGGGAAMLIAATPVQVVVCSFVYGGSKTKTKQVSTSKEEENSEGENEDKLGTPASAQNYSQSVRGMWPSGIVNIENFPRSAETDLYVDVPYPRWEILI
ncbi:AT-hook motif nuclear-localized protein 5-like [Senna tora]|uniref:AT-hook motif nuclear-localized protein n=1 Tax=Senna tora TaxID=362788 RepID=A0A834TTM8_9FABA|nr:AT-hook motif nuclear-localized protein 5-like [Senna tora]